MNYQIDTTAKHWDQVVSILEEYGIVSETDEPRDRCFCDVSEDDYNIPLLQALLTAVREGIVLRFTVWESGGNKIVIS